MVDYRALGVLLKQVQGDVRALRIEVDLLRRARERDAAAYATHDDIRDVAAVLTGHITELHQETQTALAELTRLVRTMLPGGQ